MNVNIILSTIYIGTLVFILNVPVATSQNHLSNYPPLIMINESLSKQVVPDRAIIVVKVNKETPLSTIANINEAFLFSKENMAIKFVDNIGLEQSYTQLTLEGNTAFFCRYFVVTIF